MLLASSIVLRKNWCRTHLANFSKIATVTECATGKSVHYLSAYDFCQEKNVSTDKRNLLTGPRAAPLAGRFVAIAPGWGPA